jgi:aromatic ring-opening dioxygenase catalytic subunit (LigB family)
MSLVFAGVCSHAPGITGRAARAEPRIRDAFYAKLGEMRARLEAAKPDALIVVAAEHFANFFMSNMPAYCVGMADGYEGPIEDEAWLAIKRRRVPGNAALSRRLVEGLLESIDVAYAEEWKFDHGIMVPLHFLTPRYDVAVIPVNVNCQGPPLTPLKRAYEFGRALRRTCDEQPERIALVGTGGISHWPATPDSGTINEAWDREGRAGSRSARSSPSPERRKALPASSSSTRRFRSSRSAARSLRWRSSRVWTRRFP